MLTFIVILLLGVVFLCIWGYDKYKQENFIAKAIDGTGLNSNFITRECQEVINVLKVRTGIKLNMYGNYLLLPDGQKLSFVTGNIQLFQRYSELSFEPSPIEWKILIGIVKKLYSNL